MSVRFTANVRRGMIAWALAVGMAAGAVGCSGGGDDAKKPETSISTSKSSGSQASPQEGQSADPLAELKGPGGLLLQITSAKRDSGGFVTVNGSLKNDGGSTAVIPSNLSGNETEIIRNGSSLGGATLIDPKGRKRYYVLRDTDGRPLTTTGLPALKSGETLPVFMQFPSPPVTRNQVEFQLPGFPTATIEISG
ncbi:hypothetical protein HKX69_12455 [Streptomyces argyrophyllae]|uniref:Secreted protein n=1 Tax=Streptomyces argyrophylli TaxID=2726118 RepID=A0A6M4PI11_9ACTN|nr:hypothetical protein [Streptomyces argyrophyllae]QJS10234.1 hypothetical protein HKX69_12455 [Streptomyces argyrophyllae]